MKRAITFCILGIFLIGVSVVPGVSQTSEEIIQKMIEASGGKKALEGIDDSTITGTIEITQSGYTGEITVYKKEPDKIRLDLEIMGMVITQAYDGSLAWWTNPQTGAVEEMPAKEAQDMKREALPTEAILNPAKYGISFEYKGKETVDGKDHYIIEQTYADGFTQNLYVDCTTYLMTKSKGTIDSPMGEVEFEQVASDYKKVNGFMVAHTVTTYVNGAESRIIVLKDVQYNTGLEDSLFKMEE